MDEPLYFRITCQDCGYNLTFTTKGLNEFLSWEPCCSKCYSKNWHVRPREESTTFHPIPFTEEAIAREFASCMGELHLFLMSDEGQQASKQAMRDPRGPWAA